MTRLSILPVLSFALACACSGGQTSPDGDGADQGTDEDTDTPGSGGTTGDGDGDGDSPCLVGCTDGDGDGDGDTPTGSGGTSTGGPSPNERIVGYLPTYRNINPIAVPLNQLTHLCIAFANPTGGGVDFDAAPEDITALVNAAHAEGVLVLASIAGAAGGEAVAAAIVPASVDNFVSSLLGLVTKYNLDGIDVDIEGHNVNSTYEPFVIKLSDALPEGKLLTAAVATWNGGDFPDGALARFDFINLMSYDHCGSWSDACDHSTYAESISELAYWENERGIASDRMVLGVPFYGYCWGSGCPGEALTYAELVAGYPGAKDGDSLTGADYFISYNGPETIAQKAQLAGSHGGIMIWELGQDAAGADSLLSVIHENF